MTPEQKQRLVSIQTKVSELPNCYPADFHFLLSLVKSQEADGIPEHIVMEIVETPETPTRIVKRWLLEARNGRALESVLLERDRELLERYIARFATSMRSACIEELNSLLAEYEEEQRERTEDAGHAHRVVRAAILAMHRAIARVESVSIQEQKP
jgi:hypothetical protein